MQVRPYRHQPFATCATCTRLGCRQHLASGRVLGKVADQKDQHLKYTRETRARCSARAQHARDHPEDVLYINIDGMDQFKTSIPKFPKWSKADVKGDPLKTRLLGAIVYGRGYWGYWSLPEWGATSNVTLTALCKIMRDLSGRSRDESEIPRRCAALPRKLQLQMDNTAKDNKNHYLLGFCAMLLNEGIFQEVEVYFLPVGHTHSEIDQTFSVIGRCLRKQGAYSIHHLMRLSSRAWGDHSSIGNPRKVHERLDHVFDFRRLLRYDGDCNLPLDPAGEDEHNVSRMYSFRGLGTTRGGKEDEKEKRQVLLQNGKTCYAAGIAVGLSSALSCVAREQLRSLQRAFCSPQVLPLLQIHPTRRCPGGIRP